MLLQKNLLCCFSHAITGMENISAWKYIFVFKSHEYCIEIEKINVCNFMFVFRGKKSLNFVKRSDSTPTSRHWTDIQCINTKILEIRWQCAYIHAMLYHRTSLKCLKSKTVLWKAMLKY